MRSWEGRGVLIALIGGRLEQVLERILRNDLRLKHNNVGGFSGSAGILAGVFQGVRKKLAGRDAGAPSAGSSGEKNQTTAIGSNLRPRIGWLLVLSHCSRTLA